MTGLVSEVLDVQGYAYALKLLSVREYCETVLRNKMLAKGFAVDGVEYALEKLKAQNYLSDQRFAESFLRQRLRRGELPWLAAHKARQKGVDELALSRAFAEIEETVDSAALAKEVLQQRDPQALRHGNRKLWQRHARYLQSKGFDTATVMQVMQQQENTQDE